MATRVSNLARVLGAAAGGLAVAAVSRELRRPPRRRRWTGRILGIPYDFRRPTWRRVRRAWWAPRDRALLTPRAFGLGWGVNLGRLWRMASGRS